MTLSVVLFRDIVVTGCPLFKLMALADVEVVVKGGWVEKRSRRIPMQER